MRNLLLFLTIIVLSSCSSDLYDQKYQTEVKSKIVVGKDAIAVKNRLLALLNENQDSNDMGLGRIETSFGTVRYDQILLVIDSIGIKSFTFRIDHPESSDLKFFNLVMREKSNGSIIKLMEYTMTPDFAQLYSQTMRLENFRGEIKSHLIINTSDCPDPIYSISIADWNQSGGGGGTPPIDGIPNVNPDPSDIVIVFYPVIESNPGSSGNGGSDSGGGSNDGWYDVSQSPRYFRMHLTFESDYLSDDCTKEIHGVLHPIDDCTQNFLEFLPHNSQVYLYNNEELYLDILNYILNSNDCQLATTSASHIVSGIIGGATKLDLSNLDDQITTDLSPCLTEIVEDLQQIATGGFATIMQQFIGHDTYPLNYNWKLIEGPLDPDEIGLTDPDLKPGYIAITTLNSNYIGTSTDLSWAKTIIHEAFHAYLVSVYRDHTLQDKTYKNLLDLYHKQYNGNANDVHHVAFTTTEIIPQISMALQQFGEMRGYDLSPQFYDDMAWSGLHETAAFQELDSTIQSRIHSRLSAELNNEVVNQIEPEGTVICP